jgi:cytochrome c nitrite reductase small subunit
MTDDRSEPAGPGRPWVPVLANLGALGVLVALLVGMFVGMSAFTMSYGEGWSYFSKRPETCINCHVMDDHFDSWVKSSHAHVASCADCHLPHDKIHGLIAKADNGFFHSWAFTFQDFHEPIRIKERNLKNLLNNCVDCHADAVHEMLPAEPGGDSMSCVHCHAEVGHAAWRRR